MIFPNGISLLLCWRASLNVFPYLCPIVRRNPENNGTKCEQWCNGTTCKRHFSNLNQVKIFQRAHYCFIEQNRTIIISNMPLPHVIMTYKSNEAFTRSTDLGVMKMSNKSQWSRKWQSREKFVYVCRSLLNFVRDQRLDLVKEARKIRWRKAENWLSTKPIWKCIEYSFTHESKMRSKRRNYSRTTLHLKATSL